MVGLVYVLMIWGNLLGSTHLTTGTLSPLYYILILLCEICVFNACISFATFSSVSFQKTEVAEQQVRRLATAGLLGLFVQFCLGALVRGTQSGLACSRFPSCLDSFLPIPFTLETGLAFFHRWWGVLLLGVFIQLAIATAKKCPQLSGPARRALGLAVAQVFIGIGTIMSGLETGSRATHAAVSYALWGILFYLALRTSDMRWIKKLKLNPLKV
jgi:heme A synthase